MGKKSKSSGSNTVGMITSILIILPLSLGFWFLSIVGRPTRSDFSSSTSPVRWLLAILIPLLVSGLGFKKKSLDKSGAFLAIIVGFVLTLSNYCFMAAMLMFFFTSSAMTKYKEQAKAKIEVDFKKGGQRNWVQVVCNGGVACELALLFLIERGSGGEIPINFALDYDASWFAISVLGALACCNGDTWASELGSVVGGQPRLITNFAKVPKGTNGGVTFVGLVLSAAGGFVVGFAYYFVLLCLGSREHLLMAPPQWPILATGAAAGLLGSILDSIIGATLQYSGRDSRGKIVECPGDRVEWISGMSLLDNHSVNLVSTLFTALMTPSLSQYFFTYADESSVPFGLLMII
ncbi:Transmembrane protein 19 [Halotydeus destructor]|nr:Transmembrane protein 19 [Halotydeus destructor]